MATLTREQMVTFRQGMNDVAHPTEFRPDEAALIQNGFLSYQGNAVQRRKGTQRTHPSALNGGVQGYGGIEFRTTDGTAQLVVFVGDSMFFSTDGGATWTNPSGATGLDAAYWSLVELEVGGTKYLYGANGGTNLIRWDGTTFITFSGPDTGVLYLAPHNDRLAAAGHDGPSVALSAVEDPSDWTTGGGAIHVRFQTDDGDNRITGLFSLGSTLLAFKRSSTGYLEGYGFRTIHVESGARGISRSVGCVAHRTIQPLGDAGVCWLSERGFEFFGGGGGIRLVSRDVQNFVDAITWSDVTDDTGIPTAVYLPRRHEYRAAVPLGDAPAAGGTQNNAIFIFRPATERAPEAVWTDRPTEPDAGGTMYVEDGYLHFSATSDRQQVETVDGYLSLVTGSGSGQFMQLTGGYLDTVTLDSTPAVLFAADRGEATNAPWSVGYDGFVRTLDTGGADDVESDGTGGEPVPMTIRGRPFLYGDPFRRKRARVARLSVWTEAAAEIELGVLADGVERVTRTVEVPAATGTDPVSVRVRTSVRGHALQLEARTTDDLRIAGLELRAEPLRERP